MDLQYFREHVVDSWAEAPIRVEQANRLLFRFMRASAARRQVPRNQGTRAFVARLLPRLLSTLGPPLQQHHSPSRRPFRVQGWRSPSVARSYLRAHANSYTVRRSLHGPPSQSRSR